MAVLSVNNLSKSFEPVTIFSGVSFSVAQRARTAIIGPNGIGKTALLRILAGEDNATSGTFHIARGAKIAYLPQEAKFDTHNTLWDECLQALSDTIALENRLHELAAAIAESPSDNELLEQYSKLQWRFEHMDGYNYETKMKQVLSGLGFTEDDYQVPIRILSGGQKTRAFLARLLLSEPDLLILDEPTNHLDIEAVEWLESYLRDWDGAVLIVSHDRYFLDRVITHLYEMTPIGFEMYRGNYSQYLVHREQRWQDRHEYIEDEFKRMYKELDYIRKNISKQRTQQAKGKLARLSREIRAIEKLGFFGVRNKSWSQIADEIGGGDKNTMRVEEAAQHLAALNGPNTSSQSIKLSMRARHRSGNRILQARNAVFGYPERKLFSIEEMELRRLECAALIGPNGSGKTTFLKTLLSQVALLDGELNQGASLKIGYFAQAHEELNPKLNLIEEIDSMRTGMLEKDIRNYLGRFLFSGEDHYKKVSMLSGGESGRLALAKLSLMQANLLLLDEPSNHLDIPAQEVLQQVLAEFDGTIIMVSHDRYLIDALATQVWEIDTQTKELRIFEGSYSEYRGIVTAEQEAESSEASKEKNTSVASPPKTIRLSKHEQQRLQVKIDAIEDRILNIETRLETIGKKLSNTSLKTEVVTQLGEDYAFLEFELAEALEEWEALQKTLNGD